MIIKSEKSIEVLQEIANDIKRIINKQEEGHKDVLRFVREFIDQQKEAGQPYSLNNNPPKMSEDAQSNCNSFKETTIFEQIVNHPFKGKERFAEEIQCLEKYRGILFFPYNFIEKYDSQKIDVLMDESLGLRYVLHNEKRLYFPRRMTDEEVRNQYNSLLMEQDPESPHRYFDGQFCVQVGDIFLDIGSAEALSSLDAVEKASEIFIFESGEEWIEALEATFKPYMHKVHIINEIVGKISGETSTTLDNALAHRFGSNRFVLKMDVEGAETDCLLGAQKLLTTQNVLCSCCTYHTENAAKEIGLFLLDLGYCCEYSKGFILFGQDDLKPPYFRRGVLRAYNRSAETNKSVQQILLPNPSSQPETFEQKCKKLYSLIVENDFEGKDCYQSEIDYMKELGNVSFFPYAFPEKYYSEKPDVYFDEKQGLRYVLHKKKRLYFPRKFTDDKSVLDMYLGLLVEQDNDCPHCFFTQSFCAGEGDIFVDVSCLEAINSLEVVDIASELFLFEESEDWIEALNATFAPYKDKVHIINKLVGDHSDEKYITLDEALKGSFGDRRFVIKMDAEGSEQNCISGAETLLKTQKVICACCTYHNQDDAEKLSDFFKSIGFSYTFSDGFMLFLIDNKLAAPYFRKGLIRAESPKRI